MHGGIEVRDGHMFTQRTCQVIEAIRDYSPELDVKWVPPENRRPGQAQFQIVHNNPNFGEQIIMFVKDETEFDTRVLMRIIQGDQRNGEITMSDVEAAEAAAKRVAFQKWQDERDEAIDKMYHVFKSPLNTYKVDDNLTIKDGIPFNVSPNKKGNLK